ncbi:MAG: hypothetical protein KAH56_05835 [Candidatus Krumholzibacteria bacterium]|nr:hypothetical protein [Candidatus Krumholzibacteria bacterium]
MKPIMRFFWLVSLLFFGAGCSGYQVACYTRTEGSLEPGQEVGETCDLKPGDKVRITLVDGEQAEGIVQVISSSEIVLEAKGNNLQPRGYSMDQVQSIMKNSSKSKSNTLESMRDRVNPGDNVKLVLVDGTQVRGTVWSISSSKILIEHEDQSNQPTEYSSDRIYSIETGSTGGSSSTTTTLLVVGGLALMVGLVILANEMSQLNDMFGQ